jgi:ABC-type multidrug transport system fused ATPase/permease subunit
MPEGLNTDIREKGVNLSGGEKQRLALARGILAAKNSSILLLDEPTSSVDAHNELLIYEQIFRTFHDKCILSSIHRLHLLDLFDYVYVMGQGQIVQQGTFEELRRQPGLFAVLWKKYQRETGQ